MKCLKFSEPLPEMILRREKNITWRIGDKKNIVIGDILSLCRTDGQEFVKAKVVDMCKKTFGDLMENDKKAMKSFLQKKNSMKPIQDTTE